VGLGKDALHKIAVTLLKRGSPLRLVLIRKNTEQVTTVLLHEVSPAPSIVEVVFVMK